MRRYYVKRTITNPHKVNHKLYILLVFFSLMTLFASLIIENTQDSNVVNTFADIIKNLSYGCIASTIIAWIIDLVHTKNLNKTANTIYDSIYGDLQFHIGVFVATWAELCAAAFIEKNYYEEKNTWVTWYEITKCNYNKCEPDRQVSLLDFFYKQLSQAEKEVTKSLEYLQSQRYMLTMNNAMNEEIESILSDFRFEFYALHLDLSRRDDPETFWMHMDAITKDLVKYIGNWSDIHYYNVLLFKPHGFFSDLKERINTVLISECINTNKNNHNQSKLKKDFDKEISQIKKKAKQDSQGSSSVQIQLATKQLQELYGQPCIMKNPDILLGRYAELEKNVKAWYDFWIPVLISVFTFEFVNNFLQTFKTEIRNSLNSIIQTEFCLQITTHCLCLIITFILVYFVKKIINSFAPSSDSIIVKNELCILRALLNLNKITLNENEENERIQILFNSKD